MKLTMGILWQKGVPQAPKVILLEKVFYPPIAAYAETLGGQYVQKGDHDEK